MKVRQHCAVIGLFIVVIKTGLTMGKEPASLNRYKRAKDDKPKPPPPIDSWITPSIPSPDGSANMTLLEGNTGDTGIFLKTSPDATAYVISGQSFTDLFSVNSTTGQLILGPEPSMDFEFGQKYASLVVEATAPDDSTATASITVWIIDVNDEAPTFAASQYAVVIPESTRSGDSVIRLTVSDKDSSAEFRSVILSITEGDSAGLFTVYDDGVIKVAEKQHLYNTTAFYITVQASDGVNTGFTNVIIGVCSPSAIYGLSGSDVIYSKIAVFLFLIPCFLASLL